MAGVGEDVALSADQSHIAETSLWLCAGRSLFGFGHVVIIQEASRSLIPEPWFFCAPRVQSARARSSADRVSASEAEGRGFKSLRARHFNDPVTTSLIPAYNNGLLSHNIYFTERNAFNALLPPCWSTRGD